jgi:hypothetical protein
MPTMPHFSHDNIIISHLLHYVNGEVHRLWKKSAPEGYMVFPSGA